MASNIPSLLLSLFCVFLLRVDPFGAILILYIIQGIPFPHSFGGSCNDFMSWYFEFYLPSATFFQIFFCEWLANT